MSDHNFAQEEKRHKINHLSVIAKFGTVVQFDGTVLDYFYWAIKKWNKCHILHIDVAELNLTSDDIERCRTTLCSENFTKSQKAEIARKKFDPTR
jgi:hypothetical protein